MKRYQKLFHFYLLLSCENSIFAQLYRNYHLPIYKMDESFHQLLHFCVIGKLIPNLASQNILTSLFDPGSWLNEFDGTPITVTPLL